MTWWNDDMTNPSFLSHRGTTNMLEVGAWLSPLGGSNHSSSVMQNVGGKGPW